MKKLYIIEYGRGTSWYWANSKDEAINEAKEADQATQAEIKEAEIWIIEEAIEKNELVNMLIRYIIKPLKK